MVKWVIIYTFLFWIFSGGLAEAQLVHNKTLDDDPGILFGIGYGYNIPGGDLKARFGNSLEVSSTLSYIAKNSSFQFGLEGKYIFGDTVKQDVLVNLRDANGYIIGINGDYALVKLRQRGFSLGVYVNKVFSFGNFNSRTGIRVDLGLSYMQHWIRLQDDYNTVAQFNDPYDKGYDHLTSGIALKEFIGFQYLSDNRKINFYGGFDFVQGFTKSRREIDFDTMTRDNNSRLDLLSGIKIGWILPIYIETQPEEIYY